MTTIKQTLSALAFGAAFLAQPVNANSLPPLSEVPEIDDNMLAVAMAIEISDECPTIAPRKLKGLNFLWSLKTRAAEMGYSDDEIRAYVESDEEKDRIRNVAFDYARAQGVDPTTAQGLCDLGMMEIAKGSVTGSLLRAK
ncbi:DUF5333 domain-containing protein [Celeribacter sp.]|uniref:DUF5333 domain-containing protein n=1 Tax=Celeribacter sp. TaxID=1890673 RepID=UPI003A9094F6